MIKVGLIGEDPYDKESIKNLLSRSYQNVTFKPILRTVRGGGLDSPKTAKAIKEELRTSTFDFIIFIRDLDGLPSQRDLIKKRANWFEELSEYKNDMLLLNIWELETLILADIDTFNQVYKTSINVRGNPMMFSDPKRELKSRTLKSKKQFTESDCPGLFLKLDIETIKNRCAYFKEFIEDFGKLVNPKKAV